MIQQKCVYEQVCFFVCVSLFSLLVRVFYLQSGPLLAFHRRVCVKIYAHKIDPLNRLCFSTDPWKLCVFIWSGEQCELAPQLELHHKKAASSLMIPLWLQQQTEGCLGKKVEPGSTFGQLKLCKPSLSPENSIKPHYYSFFESIYGHEFWFLLSLNRCLWELAVCYRCFFFWEFVGKLIQQKS